MTDYSTYSDDELVQMQIDLSTQRDALLSQASDIQAELDNREAERQAQAQVEQMTDEERTAMQNALNG